MRQLKITQSITNRRESHTLEKYFTEVSNVPMITPDEEVTLAKRIREGDELALEKFQLLLQVQHKIFVLLKHEQDKHV